MEKKVKLKKCKECGLDFTPSKTTQIVCSFKCASVLAEKKMWKDKKKIMIENTRTRTEMLCQWIDSTVSPWVYGSIEQCSDSSLEIPVGPQTIMAFDIAPTRRSGALVMGQVKDGKIAVGLAQLWHSDIAIDEIKMASDINVRSPYVK